MYKSTKEIQQIFSINIKEKNRTIPYVALRAFYAEQRDKELNGINNHFDIIAKEIGCNRPNVYNCLLKAKLFKEDKYTKILFEAFKTKDKSLIEVYHETKRKDKVEYQANRYREIALAEHKPATIVKTITRFDKNKAPMSNLKLAEYLRKNKVMKHELWDIPVKNISSNQWQQVRSINKNMFDSFIN